MKKPEATAVPDSKNVYSGPSDGGGFFCGIFYRVNLAGPGAQALPTSFDRRDG